MLTLFNEYDHMSDLHGAIGYVVLVEYPSTKKEIVGVFLETAHPVKFLDVLPEAIKEAVIIPESILQIIKKEKKAERIFEYRELKTFLLK